MKNNLKKIFFSVLTLAILCSTFIYSNTTSAKTYNVYSDFYGYSCSAIISKNKVYYSVTETGDLYCYNIKSGKTSTLINTNGKGFSCLKKKGGYLYAVYDAYGGSDNGDCSIVRVNIKTGKMQTLAKGYSYVIKKKTIYFEKTKRIKQNGEEYDKLIGVYSMNLSGGNQKACPSVTLTRETVKKLKNSRGTLTSSGKTYSQYHYSAYKISFTPKNGKKKTIYNIKKDKKCYNYSSIGYYTLQGDYIIYKTTRKTGKNDYDTEGILVLVKTNGKGKKVFYRRQSVSGW